MSKTFNKHMRQLDTGYYPEGFISGLRKAMHSHALADVVPSRRPKGMTQEEILIIRERISREQPIIMEPQAAKGLAYLMKHWKTPKGTERKHNPFGAREQIILTDFRRFRLVGFQDISTNLVSFYVPVYEVEDKHGNTFEYYCASWQNGGHGPIICN